MEQKVFAGTTDPAEAEEWLRNTERVLDRIECTPSKIEEFADKYTPLVYRNRKKVEFLELKRIVCCWVRAAICERRHPLRSSTEAKRKKLMGNLNPTPGQSGAVSFRGSGLQQGWYRDRGMGQTSRRHTGECCGAQPIMCYRCHQPGYIVRDCPTWRDNARGSKISGPSSVGENSQRAGTSRGRGRGGRGGGNISTTSTAQSSQPQPQARVYAITKEQAPTTPEVITSFSICGSSAHVIDPGSTCSFISHDFAFRVHASIESLGHDLCVSMPAGGVMLVNTVVRSCLVVVEDVTLYADLVVINLREFDIILGIDWLSCNHALVDCQTKEVTVEVNGHMKTVIVGERKVIPNCLISAVTAFNLIKEGCEVYLASVHDVAKISPGVSDVPVVREFPDVFPRNYLGYHLIEK
ncbi:hypothetical protein Sango_0228500 [Sesamum angolense]|uniref:CCHC-type domain-containing protein n=1 Tax=Sesamum angolense TaxID=2727404 RepID=A0AAE1XGJ0_9LAMI|nr:hypothetical protein Sango_0228500 [Sesamum angolense]